MNQRRLNVAILGQSGVGKSTLINYLFDKTTVKTGTGKPVTERGFHKTEKTINGVPVTLIDSWGIEPGKDDEWLILFKSFLNEHGIKQSVQDWVHVAFYCINAAGSRIQDFDMNVINGLLKQNIEVAVILTKAALVTPDTLEELKNTIQQEAIKQVSIIPVNSKAEILFGGVSIPEAGRNEVLSAMQHNYFNMLRLRLPERILYLLEGMIQEYKNQILFKSSTKDANNTAEKLSSQFWQSDVQDIINRELKESLEIYASTLKISLSDVKTFEAEFDYFKTIAGVIAGVGAGAYIRVLLFTLNPVVGGIVGALSALGLFGVFANRSVEIAATFEEKMSEAFNNKKQEIAEAIVQAINSTEEELSKVRLLPQP